MTSNARLRLAGPREITVPANGLHLHCTVLGEGRTVVLLHAGGERRTVWAPVAERVAAHGFRTIAVDQRGHGDTDGPIGRSLHEYASDVIHLVERLDVPVVLVGSSLGGLASILALADPRTRERVDGLVLVDVAPDPDRDRARRHLHRIEAKRSADGQRRWEWQLIESILDKGPELRRISASLSASVTMVRGTESWALHPDDSARFAALVPHATTREVPGAGHLVARDRPAELAAIVLEHLAD